MTVLQLPQSLAVPQHTVLVCSPHEHGYLLFYLKMLFFKILTQLTVSHSSNLDWDINSSEKGFPTPFTQSSSSAPHNTLNHSIAHENRNYLTTGTINFMSFIISPEPITIFDTYLALKTYLFPEILISFLKCHTYIRVCVCVDTHMNANSFVKYVWLESSHTSGMYTPTPQISSQCQD